MKNDISLKDKVFTPEEIDRLEDFLRLDNGSERADAVNISRAIDGALGEIDLAVNKHINVVSGG